MTIHLDFPPALQSPGATERQRWARILEVAHEALFRNWSRRAVRLKEDSPVCRPAWVASVRRDGRRTCVTV